MGALAGIGAIGLIVCFVAIIVSVIKRNGKVKMWLMGLAVSFILLIIGAANSGTTDNTADNATTGTKQATQQQETTKSTQVPKEAETPEVTGTPKPAEAPETTKYSDGTYLVGKDIKSGLYKVTLKDSILKMGYVERASDLNMESDSIIANIILTGNGYVEILSTDVAVKLQGVEIEPITLKNLKPDMKKEVSDGIYLVGYDVAAGTYKVEVTDTTTKMGYVQRSKSVAMGMDDIIANEIIQGPGYVKIEEGDFAVQLQGVKITLQ